MSRLQLRGVIVPSDYDRDWAKQYIDKGIIMPESAFRAQLAAAPTNEPLEVYVNSPGGSVFAANEMVNAVLEWRLANNQPVTAIVGAMAASAASAFIVMAADKVRAHANAKMMFHGAWTVSVGGKELHQDTADLLDKINGDIKTKLVSKYNIAPETVAQWFAEGREGWLTADEMKATGIASEIIGDQAEQIDFATAAIGDIEQRGLGIAAFLKTNTPEVKDGRTDHPTNDAAGAGAGEPVVPPVVEHAAAVEPPTAAEPAAAEPSAERIAGREEGRAAALAEFQDRVNELQASLDKQAKLLAAMQGDRDRLKAELARVNAQHEASLNQMSEKLKEANERAAKFLDGGLSFSTTPTTWSEALDRCGGDYVKARTTYPDVYRKFMQKT